MAFRSSEPSGFEEDDEVVAGSASGTRVRLSFLTWERIVGAVVLVALCVIFADDPAPVDDGTITLLGHSGLVESVRFSPDGETLISSSWDKSVRLWNADRSSGRPVWKESAGLPSDAEVYGAAMSPDGDTIVSAGYSGLTLWDWRDPMSLPEVKSQFGPCRAAAFSPDGRNLAVGCFDRQVRVWERGTDRILAVLSGHRDIVRTITYVPDGSMLISLSFDGVLKFWDTETYRELDGLGGKTEGVHSFALSRDGGTIALSRQNSATPRIELWDRATDRIKATCEGHEAEIHALVFSRDGRILASAGGDQQVRFWNAETGQYAGQLERGPGWVRSLDFSKDGRWLAYSGRYNQVHIKRIVLPKEPESTLNESRPG
jgi:WD40 repeat protein